MYVYIYVCIYVYIYIYIYIHARTHTFIYIYIYFFFFSPSLRLSVSPSLCLSVSLSLCLSLSVSLSLSLSRKRPPWASPRSRPDPVARIITLSTHAGYGKWQIVGHAAQLKAISICAGNVHDIAMCAARVIVHFGLDDNVRLLVPYYTPHRQDMDIEKGQSHSLTIWCIPACQLCYVECSLGGRCSSYISAHGYCQSSHKERPK